MALRLFDTARQQVVPFEPGDTVTMYVCGITPYDATHLGHAATYTTFDVIQRRLEHAGHTVRLVRNITDVDDDILRAARSRDVHYLDLSNAQIRQFQEDMAALGLDAERRTRCAGDEEGGIELAGGEPHAAQRPGLEGRGLDFGMRRKALAFGIDRRRGCEQGAGEQRPCA